VLVLALVSYKQVVRPQAQATGAKAAPLETQRALLNQYCVTCHNQTLKTGGLTLDNVDLAHVPEKAELWETVVRKLRAGLMPPPGMRRPAPQAYDALTVWLENELDKNAVARLNPGGMGMHRLNRTEYRKAIHDLLGLEVNAEELLPVDDSRDGFDNQADALAVSPTLLEAYVRAAAQISRMAVGRWTSTTEGVYVPPSDTSQENHIEGLPFGTRGGMLIRHNFPADGEYRFYIESLNNGTNIPGEQLIVTLNGETVKSLDWDAQTVTSLNNSRSEQHMEFRSAVKAGTHTVGVTFLQTNNRPSLDIYRHFSRSTLENYTVRGYIYDPAVGYVKITGPFNATGATDTPSIRTVFECRPSSARDETACADRIISKLARRAFRRPVTDRDRESLTGLYEMGRKNGSFDAGIEIALRGILADPEFIFRAEAEPANVAVGKTYRISDLELASRLSFFLWSSIPDDELIDLANNGKLKDPAVLEQQVRRMLADRRSQALVESFAAQWLFLRNLTDFTPVQIKFPDWEDNLRQAFRQETELLFESIIREDRNVVDLLTADYTFVNERLARHYGIPNIYGPQFRRVTLGPQFDARRGLLGKGSFLSVSSLPDRTSPVKRGVWVLENILGTHPPDPPPVVPPLEETPGTEAGRVLSLRERLQQHRASPACSGCHRIMDPIGLALENFDVDGNWRTKDGGEGGVPIDASSDLFDGTKINGVVELRKALLRYSPQFVRSMTERMLTYGLGRGVQYYDMPVIRSIVRDAAKNDYRFSSIVLGIVKSAPFQMRVKVKL
jgi:mono/diheme cytochrome c family protein